MSKAQTFLVNHYLSVAAMFKTLNLKLLLSKTLMKVFELIFLLQVILSSPNRSGSEYIQLGCKQDIHRL